MSPTPKPHAPRHLVPGRTLLALALALAVVGTLTGMYGASAQAHERLRLVPCLTCPHYGYFAHTASAANSAGDFTILNSPYTNAQPNAVLMVTQMWHGVYNSHNIGVWYDGGIGQWTIFNEDGASIPAGAEFNVNVVIPGSTGSTGSTAYLQQAAAGNIVWDSTVLYNPNIDNQPGALIMVTPVYGSTGQYENHAIGVWYTGSHWAIFNEDLTPMAPGELFDVVMFPAATWLEPNGGGESAGTSPPYISGDSVCIWDGSLASPIMYWVTNNWGTAGAINNHPLGVWFDPTVAGWGKWCFFEEDGAPMPAGLTFNVEQIHL